MRDYSKILDRLNGINFECVIIGTVHDYPIYQILLGPEIDDSEDILITGGIHGDEPAGVEAALRFLERDNTECLKRFRFWVIPCVNPYGYVHNTRENREGVDINRAFEADRVSEAAMVKRAIGQTRFSFAVDFHEDCDATGFYLYEGIRDEQYIGSQIAAVAKTIGSIDDDDSGESDELISAGVYKVAQQWGVQGLAPYLLRFHTEHVLISETPTIWPLEQRSALHLAVLDAAMEIRFTGDPDWS